MTYLISCVRYSAVILWTGTRHTTSLVSDMIEDNMKHGILLAGFCGSVLSALPLSTLYHFIYYQFIYHFPIGLDVLFITCFLHFFLSQTSLSIPSTAISYTLQQCPFWSYNRASAFNSILHTFVHPVLVSFPNHMSIPSQPTTSNDSCDKLTSNRLSQFFTCPSVFQGNTTYPSNHLHLCSFEL